MIEDLIDSPKKHMSAASCKGKGRTLQNETKENLYKYFPDLEEGDIRTAIMGESGRDIIFSPLGDRVVPFDIECKNQETLSIWEFMKQAIANAGEGRIPLLVFRRNRSDTYCTMRFEDLLKLIVKERGSTNG